MTGDRLSCIVDRHQVLSVQRKIHKFNSPFIIFYIRHIHHILFGSKAHHRIRYRRFDGLKTHGQQGNQCGSHRSHHKYPLGYRYPVCEIL